MQFSFKETENTVSLLFFSGFICHMGSVVPFVIPRGWFLIASGGNKPKCFQTCQHVFYYFSQPSTPKAFFFPASSPLLSCTTLATTIMDSHVSYHSLYCLPVGKWHLWSVVTASHLLVGLNIDFSSCIHIPRLSIFEDLWETLKRPISFTQIWSKFIQYSELVLLG